MEHLSLMSNFIVLVEALIGYFKKIIQPNISILYSEMHIGSTCMEAWCMVTRCKSFSKANTDAVALLGRLPEPQGGTCKNLRSLMLSPVNKHLIYYSQKKTSIKKPSHLHKANPWPSTADFCSIILGKSDITYSIVLCSSCSCHLKGGLQ